MSKDKPKGARALTGDELRELLAKLRTSEFCQKCGLVDPITMLIATGLRRSELLGLRWADYLPGRGDNQRHREGIQGHKQGVGPVQ